MGRLTDNINILIIWPVLRPMGTHKLWTAIRTALTMVSQATLAYNDYFFQHCGRPYVLHGLPFLNSRSFDLSMWMVYLILLLVVLFIQIFCCNFYCLPFTMGINTKNSYIFQSWDATSISLSAACDLFMRFVTRTSHLEHEKFDAAKSRLIERGEKFGEISLKVITQSRTFILVYILKFMPFF